MITIGEIQFGGMVAMSALAFTQIMQTPRRVTRHPVYGWARWLMASGLAVLSLQFLLQYAFGFRAMGVTQAVFINELFFIPCIVSMSLAILYVQRQGKLSYNEWMMGWRLYALAAVILIGTALADDVPFREESKALRHAEYAVAAIYIVLQLYYFALHFREYRRLRKAVEEYYDRDYSDMLHWMGLSIVLLTLASMFAPLFLFSEGWPLIAFSVFFFCLIYYCASSFHSYGISLDAERVEEAEESMQTDAARLVGKEDNGKNAQTVGSATSIERNQLLTDATRERIAKAAETWVLAGGFRETNLTLTVVAGEMKVQRYLLKAWLQEGQYRKLSTWLNYLRTEDAKRLMAEHPDWGLDTVAIQSGFGSRQYFHKVFHEQTGITPTKFMRQ